MELKRRYGTGGYGPHSATITTTNNSKATVKYRNIGTMAIDKASARSESGSADVIYIADRRSCNKKIRFR